MGVGEGIPEPIAFFDKSDHKQYFDNIKNIKSNND